MALAPEFPVAASEAAAAEATAAKLVLVVFVPMLFVPAKKFCDRPSKWIDRQRVAISSKVRFLVSGSCGIINDERCD